MNTGRLCWEFTGHRWIPLTKLCDTELCCFLWSAPEKSWVNNRNAGDLRRHRAHYGPTVVEAGSGGWGYPSLSIVSSNDRLERLPYNYVLLSHLEQISLSWWLRFTDGQYCGMDSHGNISPTVPVTAIRMKKKTTKKTTKKNNNITTTDLVAVVTIIGTNNYVPFKYSCPTTQFNSLWYSDNIRRSTWSTLVQVMAWCLSTPSHYLN